uniref:MICOS complex subunit MIC10 n=1 Tax=Esox lucius TaxID=8010 RepID=A0A6Q2Y2M7_ESOLU
MSEKDLQKKLDRCLADCTVKLGAGLGLGIVFSVVFFKRRTWPITFGLGTGLGMAYTNCQNDLRTPYLLKRNMKVALLSPFCPVHSSLMATHSVLVDSGSSKTAPDHHAS